MSREDPFESDEDFVGTLLREAAFDAPLDWEQFASGVMAGLDGDGSPEPERVLRVDEVDAEEAADADWVDGLPPVWASALRGISRRELAAVEDRFAGFAAAVSRRLDRPVVPDPDHARSVGELLRTDARAELGRREGDWTAFGAQLAARLDREVRAEQARPLEERAFTALKREVDRELGAVAPRFEGDFRAAVDARVREVGPPGRSGWSRASQGDPGPGRRFWRSVVRAVRRAVSLEDRGLGVAAAAAAAALLVVWVTSSGPAPGRPVPLTGTVRVEEVTFQGSVAVMPEDGVTVVFLSDTPEV